MTYHKLLLVHPDPLGAAMLCSMIRPLGLSLDEAEDDRTAARRLDQGPALLLAAVNPSDPDALELLIYARRRHPEIPVLLLFPAHDAGRADEALRLGATAVMKFPCPPAELRTAVAVALRQDAAPAPARPALVSAVGVEVGGSGRALPRRPSRALGGSRNHDRNTPGSVRVATARQVDVSEGRPAGRRAASGALLPLKKALEGPERRILLEALDAMDWNRREAARVLQINRTTLYKKLKKYGLLSAGPGGDD